MKISDSAFNNKAHLVAHLTVFSKIMLLFKIDEAQVLRKQYPLSLIKIDIFFQALPKNVQCSRCVHKVKVVISQSNFSIPKSPYPIHSLSSRKNIANTTLAIPLVVIKAKFTRLKSFGF